jgi:GTP-binding protein EngB required for normal cell division
LEASPIDLSMLAWLREKDIPHQPVGTKVDRMGRAQQAEARTRLAASIGADPNDIAWVSAKEGYGMKEFRANVRIALGLE